MLRSYSLQITSMPKESFTNFHVYKGMSKNLWLKENISIFLLLPPFTNGMLSNWMSTIPFHNGDLFEEIYMDLSLGYCKTNAKLAMDG